MSAPPVTVANIPFFGPQARRMAQVSITRGFSSNVWIPQYAIEPLGLSVSGRGILSDRKGILFNADQTSDPARFAHPSVELAAEQHIPTSIRGHIMPTAMFGPMSAAMREHNFRLPFWLTEPALKQFDAKVLPDATRVAESFTNSSAKAFTTEFFPASQTSNPGAFTIMSCNSYLPKIVPHEKMLHSNTERLALAEIAINRQYTSQLWVESSAVFSYGFELHPGTTTEEVAISFSLPDGTTLSLINGNCFTDGNRVDFFETYEPTKPNGMTFTVDRWMLVACAFECKLQHTVWADQDSLRSKGIGVLPDAVAVDINDGVNGASVTYVNAAHTRNPEKVTLQSLAYPKRRTA